MLAQKGDAEGAKAVWRPVIEFGAAQYAGQAFTDLADLLREEEDIDGLRAAYDWAAGLGNPDAAYALDALGSELNRIGDTQGAHKARQQAIDASYAEADWLRDRMAPPKRAATRLDPDEPAD